MRHVDLVRPLILHCERCEPKCSITLARSTDQENVEDETAITAALQKVMERIGGE